MFKINKKLLVKMGRIILHNRIFTDNYGINYAIIIMFFK